LITDVGAAVACFFATLLAMVALRPVAVAVELVDKPGGRKTHRGEIPVVGGIAMFLGCIFGVGLAQANQFVSAPLLSAAALVVLVGMLDDRFEISPFARLTAHLVAALLALTTTPDLSIHTLGHPFGASPVVFDDLGSAAFTCVAIMGAINAFNMLDGMDGLAGTMAFIALVALATMGGMVSDGSIASVALVVGGAVAAFLVFNIPAKFNRRFRCFMGDAGSTLLGFLLSCLCISISQGDVGSSISPTTTLWFVAIPLFELLWTTLRRVLKGRSPFHPDRAHFHHKLLDAGFGVRGAFIVLIGIGTLLAGAGMAIEYLEISDAMSFALWLLAGLGMVLLMHNARVFWYVLPRSFRRRPDRGELTTAPGTR
jgi:UDP-GlcNAc:undecaprenyl-phosphate/decaprenyl-phosphate GlcNAc-1-phosphate transferase